jgi:thiol-disulfide isomerase/thioredoxin
METYYTLLGVEPEASQEDIDAAYQQQRERYRAELVAEMDDDIRDFAAQRTTALEQAYQTLSDPQRRQQYDASIGSAPRPAATAPRRAGLSGRERWYAGAGVLVALLLIGAVWTLTGDRSTMPSAGEVDRPVPALSLPTLDGGELNFADYHGQVVLVNFWGTWCEPCKRETPELQAAYEQLQGEGFVIIGVNVTDDELTLGNTEDDIRAFADQYQISYPIALDVEGEAMDAFSGIHLPTSFFIDAEGRIRYMRIGEVNAEEIQAFFRRLSQDTTARLE